jgi:hypothetical protein
MNPKFKVLCSTPEEAAIADMAIGLAKIKNTPAEFADNTGIRKHAFYLDNQTDLEEFEMTRKEIENRLNSGDAQTLTQYNGDQKKYLWVGTKHLSRQSQ